MLSKSAQWRKHGVRLIDHLVKEAQGGSDQMSQMRRGAQWNVGLQDLGSEFGLDPQDSMAHQRAMAENEDYYNRMRGLYDQYMAPPQAMQQQQGMAAAAPNTAVAQEPKVITPPK